MPVCRYIEFPLSDNWEWDADEAEKGLRKWASSDGSGDKDKIDWDKLAKVFMWHKEGELENFEDLKFPYCRIENGEPHVVHNALQAILSMVDRSNIPEDEKEKVANLARRHLERFQDSGKNNMAEKAPFGKVTDSQLEKINKMAFKPLKKDEIFVFYDLMIDDQLVESYHFVIHENLLNKFLEDVNKGIPLLLHHDVSKLPVGRSFEGKLVKEKDETYGTVTTLYGSFYIDLGRNLDSGVSTDDIVKGILSGAISDTSIGFRADSMKCSICGNDIRNFMLCEHIPGVEYYVERDGKLNKEVCYAILGEDGKGELLENSLVYAGACDRAGIVGNFSAEGGVKETKEFTKLQLVDNIKSVPLDSSVYVYYSKTGTFVFANQRKESGGKLEQFELNELKELMKEFNIEFETKEDLKVKLKEVLTGKDTEIESLKQELKQKDDEIECLKKEVEQLQEKATLGETYRKDLIEKAIELGIRTEGNSFKADLFRKFFETLSIEELKEYVTAFEEKVKMKFGGSRVSKLSDRSIEKRDEELLTRDDFETEEEFRQYVAEKAKEYAEKNNVSLSIATKEIYKKLVNKESE